MKVTQPNHVGFSLAWPLSSRSSQASQEQQKRADEAEGADQRLLQEALWREMAVSRAAWKPRGLGCCAGSPGRNVSAYRSPSISSVNASGVTRTEGSGVALGFTPTCPKGLLESISVRGVVSVEWTPACYRVDPKYVLTLNCLYP